MPSQNIYILGIESSCDDTAAAVLHNGKILSNVVATQEVHKKYGGVVPELASRAHQQNIVPVIHEALERAGITKDQLSAIAFTRGPGLMGSLLVGTSFAKSLSLGLGIPLLDVNHMQAHILAHYIEEEGFEKPRFSFSRTHHQRWTYPNCQSFRLFSDGSDWANAGRCGGRSF